MSCPNENWAQQVDNTRGSPYTSRTAPEGQWGQNELGNVWLKEPNHSFHYWNRDGGYFFQKGTGPNEYAEKLYISPTRDRYFTPSPDKIDDGLYYVGVFWQSSKEKICWREKTGKLSLSFRKNVEPEGLQRRRIAIYNDRYGNQQVVEVDGRGVYTGQDENVWHEIQFWLANNVPEDFRDGPTQGDGRLPRAVPNTPPPEVGDDDNNRSLAQRIQDLGAMIADFADRARTNAPPAATPNGGSPARSQSSVSQIDEEAEPQIKEEAAEAGSVDLDVVPSSSSSAQRCRDLLFAARRGATAQGGRVSKGGQNNSSSLNRAALNIHADAILEALQK